MSSFGEQSDCEPDEDFEAEEDDEDEYIDDTDDDEWNRNNKKQNP